YAEAHYNLSFVLSALGDYAGSLRSARRGMELDPYYVAPAFSLAIDAQHEGMEFAVTSDIDTGARTDSVDSSFVADESSLDAVFMELAGEPNTDDLHEGESAPDRAREALADGRLADAGAAATAALAAGGSTADALVISGQVFSALGLDGEALERFRSALATDSTRLDARVGESRTLVRLGRAEEARQSLGALV